MPTRLKPFAPRYFLPALSLLFAAGYAQNSLAADTATPIEHVVVIFQENVSFDHYFATYPTALNPPNEPNFVARENTPSVNGLGTLVNGQPQGTLLTDNPNANNPANAPFQTNPFRFDRTQVSTCDQDHNYGPEQAAFDKGLMDLFPFSVGVGENTFCAAPFAYGKGQGLVMGYFDGNTVTALWNYAQHFAMSDNSYGTTFGPSTPGVLNLVAGNTYPAIPSAATPKVVSTGTLVGDLDPTGDVCSQGTTVQIGASTKSIGDLLNAQHVTWGSFMGGFDLTVTNPNGTTGCTRSSPATAANAGPTADYIPHHAFFQYFASTANPTHKRPSSIATIGTASDGGANHEYDVHDFFDALAAGNMPAVSFLKAPAFEDGHAGYSDPLLEQGFVVKTVNAVMGSRFWGSTAIIIMYDDSDGWYDHQMSPIVNPSADGSTTANDEDQFNAPGQCGNGPTLADNNNHPIEGRCGHGPRLPLLVVSPWAKDNFVDHSPTDQSSVLRFIEDNWKTGRLGNGSFDQLAGPIDNMFDFDRDHDDHHHDDDDRDALFLDPSTGQPTDRH
jgi:phospholipase C